MVKSQEDVRMYLWAGDNGDMLIGKFEISWDSYKDVNDLFSKDTVDKVREHFKENCTGAANLLRDILDENNILASTITFKNGHAFVDEPLKVFGHKYTHHSLTLVGNGIIDILHSDKIFQTKEYIEMLEKDNPKLRIDSDLSMGWFTQEGDNGFEGWLYMPTLQELKDYKY